MTRTIYHVTKSEKGWEAKREDRPMAAVKGTTKKAVVSEAIALAKKHMPSQIMIHKVNGRIQEERTYPRSSDPRRTKG